MVSHRRRENGGPVRTLSSIIHPGRKTSQGNKPSGGLNLLELLRHAGRGCRVLLREDDPGVDVHRGGDGSSRGNRPESGKSVRGPKCCSTPTSPRSSSLPTPPGSTRSRTRMWSATATGRFSPPGSSIPRGTWTHRAPHFRRPCSGVEGTGHPAHGRVRPLEFIADGITHSLQWENGTEFLRELLRLLEKADPDLLVTEYGDDWLLPRLLALAGRLRVPLPLGRPHGRQRATRSDARRSGRTFPTAG